MMEILIADDHALYRNGICRLVKEINSDFIIHEVENHSQALTLLAEKTTLDLIIYDLSMPGMNGLDAVQHILTKFPATPIAVLSASENPYNMQRVIDIGAMGFIPKSSSNATIKAAIQVILSGNYFIPNNAGSGPIDDLTYRQLEILHKLKEGKSNKEIGNELKITHTTVKAHLHTIFQILGVSNRTQAANAVK